MTLTWTILVAGASVVAYVFFVRWLERRVAALFEATRRDGMVAHSVCMIRDGAMACPGIALVADNHLTIQTVFGKKRCIPLSSVTVKREAKGSGKYAWWGKQVFHLDTPATTNLAIGVKEPEPWRNALMPPRGGGAVKPTS